jgi:hypothetical protein
VCADEVCPGCVRFRAGAGGMFSITAVSLQHKYHPHRHYLA